MTETTLRVNHEMVLAEELKYTKFQTNSVKNFVEEQTLEKGYQAYSATSADNSTVTWSIPSISGGSMVRELDVECPVSWTISCQAVAPNTIVSIGIPTVVGANFASITLGTSPRAFLSEINTIDMFPLSKIFGNREYIINNSSTILKEEFQPEQIDMMVSQLDLKKLENMGVKVFSDANSHFRILAHSVGGQLRPYSNTANAQQIRSYEESVLSELTVNLPSPVVNASFAQLNSFAGTLRAIINAPARTCAGVCEDWFHCRNTARNVISSTVELTSGVVGVSTGKDNAFGANPVLVNSSTPSWSDSAITAVFYSNAQDFTVKVTMVMREKIISQYWDNDLTYKKFAWNQLMPVSSLNIKMNINSTYLNESVLKIGDNVAGYTTYKVSSNPSVSKDLNKIKLHIRQQKVPLALLPRQSWKLLYYSQERPQASKDLSFGSDHKVKANMTYSNLSQIPEYLFIYLPINKSKYIETVYPSPINSNAKSNTYQLPSTFNLPISNLVLTFNADTALATYGLDSYQLQQFTMDNLQDNENLRNLIVGESKCAVGEFVTTFNSTFLKAGIPAENVNEAYQAGCKAGMNQVSKALGGSQSNQIKYNGVSNSSFYILKLGSQIRLPEGYTPSQIVNYNLNVQVECDVNSDVFLKREAGYESDLSVLQSLASDDFQKLTGKLEVVHFNKRIMTLSGDALQNLYVHNVQITSAEYGQLQTDFELNFASMEKEDVFNTDMMIGGSLLSRLKDKAMSAISSLGPLSTARKAVNLAKCVGVDPYGATSMADKGLSWLGSGEDPHAVGGAYEVGQGKKRGRKSGSVDWRSYLSKM